MAMWCGAVRACAVTVIACVASSVGACSGEEREVDRVGWAESSSTIGRGGGVDLGVLDSVEVPRVAFLREIETLNRPGDSGESFRWKDLSHATSLEVPDRAA